MISTHPRPINVRDAYEAALERERTRLGLIFFKYLAPIRDTSSFCPIGNQRPMA